MKKIATNKHKVVVAIPMIVRFAIVIVELQLAIIVAVHIEHVRIAVRVGYVQNIIFTTTFRILSRLYLIRNNNSPIFYTKYLHFC